MPQDEPDISNFSTSSEHKLPAINGAQALQDELRRARGISTNLPGLDKQLGPSNSLHSSNGIRRGQVTEIFGPPGSGKSTMGMQIAVNAIRSLDSETKVAWLATSSPLMHSRLHDIANPETTMAEDNLPSSPRPQKQNTHLEDQFIYHEITILAHLLVMLMHPTAVFPPPKTSVLIIDGLANFLLGALPRRVPPQDAKNNVMQTAADKRANSRRFQIIDSLASALSRLAASRHIAIVVLMSATTAIKNGQRAVLRPALNRPGWEAAINTRITLYRDFYPQQYRDRLTRDEKRGYRLAEVTRLNFKEVFRDPVPFVVETAGLRELEVINTPMDSARPPPLPPNLPSHPQSTPMPAPADLPEIRSSQVSLPPDNLQSAFPTASQLLRQEYAATGSMPVINNELGSTAPLRPQAQQDMVEQISVVEDTETPTTTRPILNEPNSKISGKRKAIEIADSEDEDEDLDDADLPQPTLPPPTPAPVPVPVPVPAEIESNRAGEEEMLFS